MAILCELSGGIDTKNCKSSHSLGLRCSPRKASEVCYFSTSRSKRIPGICTPWRFKFLREYFHIYFALSAPTLPHWGRPET
jgi:hypothetical protein